MEGGTDCGPQEGECCKKKIALGIVSQGGGGGCGGDLFDFLLCNCTAILKCLSFFFYFSFN